MIRKKFLYSTVALTLVLQVGSGSPSLAMEYPAYDKSGNAVGTLGVKRRDQDVLEFTLKSNQTGKYVGFDNPTISYSLKSSPGGGYDVQEWQLDVDKQTRKSSLDLSKEILFYAVTFYAPNQFHLKHKYYTPGASIQMQFSDGNFVRSVAFPFIVLTSENMISKENKNTKRTLGSLILETICPQQMSKRALKKAKKETQAERRASREVESPLSDEEKNTRKKQATNARKALKNYRTRQQRKWR